MPTYMISFAIIRAQNLLIIKTQLQYLEEIPHKHTIHVAYG